MLRGIMTVGLVLFAVLSAEANSRPSLDEMWELIQKQQAEINSLKKVCLRMTPKLNLHLLL